MTPDSKSLQTTLGTIVATVIIGGLGSFGAQALQAWMEKYYVPRAEFLIRMTDLEIAIEKLKSKP